MDEIEHTCVHMSAGPGKARCGDKNYFH